MVNFKFLAEKERTDAEFCRDLASTYTQLSEEAKATLEKIQQEKSKDFEANSVDVPGLHCPGLWLTLPPHLNSRVPDELHKTLQFQRCLRALAA